MGLTVWKLKGSGVVDTPEAERKEKRLKAGSGRSVQDTHQLGPDLTEPVPVNLPFLMDEPRQIGRRFHVRRGVLLDFQVDHFLEQLNERFRTHAIP